MPTREDATLSVRAENFYVLVRTTGFSGATLLASLLSAHPDVATVAEANGLPPHVDASGYRCSCGELLGDCSFWRSVAEAMQTRGVEFDAARHFDTDFHSYGSKLRQKMRRTSFGSNKMDTLRDWVMRLDPGERRFVTAVVERNEALVDSILDVTQSKMFVDTSKGQVRFRALHALSNLDLRVIHLIRDARGVVASTLRHGWSKQAKSAAKDWVKIHGRIERDLALLDKSQWLRVRYEDLCREPEATLLVIYKFLQLDPTLALDDYSNFSLHLIGNSMRMKTLSEIRLDERWREMLTMPQLEEIEAEAGKLRRRYGYGEQR